MIRVFIAVGSRYPVNRTMIRETVRRVLAEKGMEDAEVSVSVVGARKMIELNEGLMKHQGVTDVLSFPQMDPEQPDKDFPIPLSPTSSATPPIPRQLGDIVVCFPEAVSAARKLGRMVNDHICFLVEHGLMHLLGFHHP